MCFCGFGGLACAGAEVGGQQSVESTGVGAFGVLEKVQEGCELALAEVQVGQRVGGAGDERPVHAVFVGAPVQVGEADLGFLEQAGLGGKVGGQAVQQRGEVVALLTVGRLFAAAGFGRVETEGVDEGRDEPGLGKQAGPGPPDTGQVQVLLVGGVETPAGRGRPVEPAVAPAMLILECLRERDGGLDVEVLAVRVAPGTATLNPGHRQIRFQEALGDSSGIVARPPRKLS